MQLETRKDPHIPHLIMEFNTAQNFCQILQSGFQIRVQVGCSLKHLLCQQFGLKPDYVDGFISTIFLDGHPVDDLEKAIVNDGATLALSAAMPGLVGATMRKGGYYAELRSGISHHHQSTLSQLVDGAITLKLFNVVADDLGSTFLKHGIRLDARHLQAFLQNRPESFWQSCTGVRLNEHPIKPEQLRNMDWLRGVKSVRFSLIMSGVWGQVTEVIMDAGLRPA